MFSIIIPVGPSRDGHRALSSLEQAGISEGDQVIVVGDGHQPEVHAFSDKLPLQIISTPKVSGANTARNLGASIANQSYLCFLDDDDEYLPNALETLRSLIEQKSDVAVWSLSWKMASKRSVPRTRRKEKLTEVDIFRRNVAGGCSSMVVKSTAFREVGGFDPEMRSMQDWDLWLRLVRLFPIQLTTKSYILYHDHDAPRISTNPAARLSGLERLLKKNAPHWPASVCAFHRARLAAEQFKAGKASWWSIFQIRAPIASVFFAFKGLCLF